MWAPQGEVVFASPHPGVRALASLEGLAWLTRIRQNHLCRPPRQHHRGSVNIARRDRRECRSINHAQTSHTMNVKPRIHH